MRQLARRDLRVRRSRLRQAVLESEISPNEVIDHFRCLGEEPWTPANWTIFPGSFSFGCG